MPAPSRRIEEIAADELFTLCGEGSAAADGLLGRARQSVRDMVATDGAIDPASAVALLQGNLGGNNA